MEDHSETQILQGRGVWEHYTLQDGLPDMKIECIYEDREGLVWVGTHDGGVACYDGYDFKTFNRRDGLAGNGVFGVLEDRDGCLWFSTNMGLSRYDGEHFETFNPEEPSSFLWGSCMDLEGNLWFGMEGKPGRPPAVCLWDREELAMVYLDEYSEEHDERGYSINDIVMDKEGRIWMGGDGLYCYEGEEFSYVEPFMGLYRQITSLICAKNDDLWVVSMGEIKTKEGKRKNIDNPNHCHFLRVVEGERGEVWFITHGSDLVKHKDNVTIVNDNLKNYNLQRFFIDRAGKLWLGGYGTGLFCYDESKVMIYESKEEYLSEGVNCLAKSKNEIYIGTGNGILKMKIEKELIAASYIVKSNNYNIISMLMSDENTVWAGTRLSSIIKYSKGNIEIIGIPNLHGFSVAELQEDIDSNIWFGFRNGQGLGYCLDGQIFRLPLTKQDEYPIFVGALEVDKTGCLWIGSASPTSWDGVCKYDGDSFIRIPGISGCSIHALCMGENGLLWIGTNEGLYSYATESGKISNYARREGLPCEIVTVIVESKDGTLWLGTEGGGVCCFDGKVFQAITISENLDYNIINDIVEDDTGKMWFATTGGLVQYSRQKSKPKVWIKTVIADQVDVTAKSIDLPKTTKSIRINLKGYSSIDNIRSLVYRYRLQGVGSGWEQTNKNLIEFTNIDPGDYTLCVQAVDQDLNYSSIERMRMKISEAPWISALSQEKNGKKKENKNQLNKGNLLLVDPDESVTKYCNSFLRRAGFNVLQANTMEEGYHILINHEIDIMLVDLSMLSDAVYDIFNSARQHNIEVIVLTEFEDLVDGTKDRLGIFNYIVKPFQGKQLLSLVEKTLVIARDPLLEYIRLNIGVIRSREDVAKQFKVTPNTLSNRIYKIAGCSFSEYIKTCRIQAAQVLLINSDLNVKQIALRVGFDTSEGFIRAFGKSTGQSPLQYRKELLALAI